MRSGGCASIKLSSPTNPSTCAGRRCDPWSAPHHEGVGRQYKASSTMAGTRIVSACSRGRNTRDGFLRRPSSRRAIRGCRRGTAFQRMRAIPAAPDGSRCGVHRARGRPSRPARRRADRLGYGENTLIFYIWGDNGSSAEGQNGTISRAHRPERHSFHCGHAHRGARSPRWSRNARVCEGRQHAHAGWGWAGSTPYKGTKLVASHFGGPAIRWRCGGPRRSRRTRDRARNFIM